MYVMRLLNGRDLSDYIKERQASRVRSLLQANGITPKLAIVAMDFNNPVIDIYMRLKTKYGNDILINVDIHRIPQSEAKDLLSNLNNNKDVHGIIIQLPLEEPQQTDELLNLVDPNKDVDGLASDSKFEPATALAIMWLLAGYNIEVNGKNVVLVGHGKLVGKPLERLLIASGVTPTIIDINTPDPKAITLDADIIISATGVGGLIKPDMLQERAVVIDAGVASEGGKTIGDVAPEVYARDDLTITPVKGGVGPLTVCALFDNVIRAAETNAQKQKA
jgi:methylenetetrahydrofolate dehydrogenase (NADP+)/methenyltetrahydrofolate cyclohydrolase